MARMRMIGDRPLTGAERTRRYREKHKEKCYAALLEYRAKNPEKIKEISRRSHHKNPVRKILQCARSRAKKYGLEFNLEASDIIVPVTCPVLGIAIACSNAGFSDSSPTLDRIDNSLGYVKGNVAVISWRANRIKCDATPEELAAIARYAASARS